MARIDLTIATDYQPHWGVWEGLRELIANALDAETEHTAKCTLAHNERTNTLTITNDGVTLDRSVLLLGTSSKRGRDDTVGQFGEGLKIGVLALVRAGHAVKIRTGGETWVPSLRWSNKFGSNVLSMDVASGAATKNRVSVEVGGIDREQYEVVRGRFRRLADSGAESVTCSGGSLLTGQGQVGRIHVRGVYIRTVEGLQYGYDLVNGALNRDRDVVGDLDGEIHALWSSVLAEREEWHAPWLKLVATQAKDAQGFSEWSASYLPKSLLDSAAASFLADHGENAIPVETAAQASEAAHYGAFGVDVGRRMAAILTQRVDTLAKVRERLGGQVSRVWREEDLSAEQLAVWRRAKRTVSLAVYAEVGPDCELVSFSNPALRGLYLGGKVQVSVANLSDHAKAVRVLVHEWSHRYGGDGTKGHVEAMEETWQRVLELTETNPA